MCEHAGLLNHLYAKIDDLEIGPGQVVAQTAPQCFDISLWQLISGLLAGGRTLLVEQEVILDARRFLDKVAAGRVAVLQVVPSYLDVVLSCLEQQPRELADLRYVSVTGEALKKELTQRWFAAQPDVKLVNAYGLTETSDDTNHEVMDRTPEGTRVPLGRPVSNVRIYLLDEHLSPRTATERRLAAAWAAVLGIPPDQIGRRDNFFDRGGTSLSAVKLAISLDRAVSLAELIRHPVLADLAELVERAGARPERRSAGSTCS